MPPRPEVTRYVRNCARCGERFIRIARSRAAYCPPCYAWWHREWRAANPEKSAAIRLRHRDRQREQKREKWLTDPAWRERNKAYYAANKDRWRDYNHRRRTLLRSGPIEALLVLERDDGICGICGRDVDPFKYEIDHTVPLSRGGAHSYENVQVAHPRCNRQKNNREDYIGSAT